MPTVILCKYLTYNTEINEKNIMRQLSGVKKTTINTRGAIKRNNNWEYKGKVLP